jgi:CheY-like chemotaxis protein
MSVFIIEDSHIDASLMREMLASEGVADVRIFGSAEQALAEADAKNRPQLFLADVRLPGMSGIEFARAAKSRPDLAPVPVVCISTSALREEINAAYEAGASGYFVKPSNIEAFELIASAIYLMWFDARISRAVDGRGSTAARKQ